MKLDLAKAAKYINDEEIVRQISKETDGNDEIVMYQLPENQVVLSVYQPPGHECPSGYIHINMLKPKCPIKKCSRKPHYHYHVTTSLMCLHIMLCNLVSEENELPPPSIKVNAAVSTPQFCKVKTTRNVIENIQSSVPSLLEKENETVFLQKSLLKQLELFDSRDLTENEVKKCESCQTNNVERKKKVNHSYLVTPGYMVKIAIIILVLYILDAENQFFS